MLNNSECNHLILNMVDTVVCRENYGSSSVSKVYVTRENGDFVVMNKSAKWTSVSQVFRSVFLPQGYPESVSSDYLTYQIWDTIQAFASSITGTLAAQAVLKGVGVGDENATVLAATMTWIIKDGTGMLGRILFAWLQGTSLDCDAKRWRLFADILNDFAIFVEILAPNFPGFFRPIICTSGVCKSIVGVAGGATRAALTQHQARRNNMADVSAKDGSQETLVNLAALLCSLVLIPLVTGREMVIWTLFVIFTSLHLYANYSAVTCVVMETLNQARLHIIVNKYATLRLVPSVVDTNKAEPVVWKTSRRLKIRLGTSLSRICSSTKEMESLLSIYKDSKYLLALNLKKGEVGIVLSVDSDVADHIQSCFQAEIIEHIYCCLYRTNPVIDPDLRSLVAALEEGDVQNAAYHSYRYTCSNIQTFRRKLQENGWLLDPALMCAEEWRARWDIEGISDKKEF